MVEGLGISAVDPVLASNVTRRRGRGEPDQSYVSKLYRGET